LIDYKNVASWEHILKREDQGLGCRFLEIFRGENFTENFIENFNENFAQFTHISHDVPST